MGLDLAGAPDVAEREEQGVTVTLLDDTGEAMMEGGLPVTMTVVGTYSKTYRTAKAATERKFQKTIRRQGHVDSDEWLIDIYRKCVTGWVGVLKQGAPLPCTPDTVALVLAAYPGVLRQVHEAVEDHASFFKTASGS